MGKGLSFDLSREVSAIWSIREAFSGVLAEHFVEVTSLKSTIASGYCSLTAVYCFMSGGELRHIGY